MGDPDRLAYLVFTSGSSGTPKPVAHAHRAIWARRMMWDGWYDLRPDDRVLHAGAFNWTFTLGTGLLDPWAIGATALIPAAGTAPEALPLLLKRHDATIFAAAPGVFRKILNAGGPLALPEVATCARGRGEKLPEALRRARWQAANGTTIHEALGMSECSTSISGKPRLAPRPRGTLGHPQPGRCNRDPVRRRPRGPHRARPAIPRHPAGLRPRTLMLGISHRGHPGPAASAATGFSPATLFRPTRTARWRYHGRRDDLMTTGGLSAFSPLEVEAAFQGAPGITDCAATAVEIKPRHPHVIALA